ncbi:protein of unknown function [Cupriavidus taiwanensis]|uniref:Uncharacterized protein n=1 Tax=Cupriavidus taiwanensis TaxID=164546 RepID=A0A375IIR8_9BURK|nr:protein of unknown function [Cupriavidus taiwanensis]
MRPPCVRDGGSLSAVNRVGEHEAGLTDRHTQTGEPEGSPAAARPYGRALAKDERIPLRGSSGVLVRLSNLVDH